MKYTITVRGTEIEVDELEFGVHKGSPEGNVDLYIRVADNEEDIYTGEAKKTLWTEWLDACLEDKQNPGERIRKVEAKVFGGESDSTPFRTLVIEHGFLADFDEHSQGIDYGYTALIRRAPRKKGEISVKAG